jgi:CRP/FNR family cyclic AMP-dependent transcriptional regulator
VPVDRIAKYISYLFRQFATRFLHLAEYLYTSYSARVRLARMLVRIAISYGRRTPAGIVVGFGLRQSEWASLCGVAEVTTQAILRDFRCEGLLITSYRRITIVDLVGLRLAGKLDANERGEAF